MEIDAAVKLLRGMKQLDDIRTHCKKITQLEHDGDQVFRSDLGEMFGNEKDAIRLIKHKEFLEGLETTLDRCDDVAQRARDAGHQERVGASCTTLLLAAGPRRRGRADLRLHQRLPRHRQRHRHRRRDRRAPDPRRRCSGGGAQFRRRAPRARPSPATIGKGLLDPSAVTQVVVLARAARRDRLEPVHLVLRHPVVVVARARGRARRRRGSRRRGVAAVQARGPRQDRQEPDREPARRASSSPSLLMIVILWIVRRGRPAHGQPDLPPAADRLGGLHGAVARQQRRAEDDGHHHDEPRRLRRRSPAAEKFAVPALGRAGLRHRDGPRARRRAACGSSRRWARRSSISSRSTASPPRRARR